MRGIRVLDVIEGRGLKHSKKDENHRKRGEQKHMGKRKADTNIKTKTQTKKGGSQGVANK